MMAIGKRAILRKAKVLRSGRFPEAGGWGLGAGSTINIGFSLEEKSICHETG
jgi:hypothetical protein